MRPTRIITSPLFVLAGLLACDEHAPDVPPHDAQPQVDERSLSPIAQAIVLANADVDESLNLVARIEVQEGELLEFYEPVDGVVIVSGAGQPAGPPIITAELVALLSTEALWELAAEGEPMPTALTAAVERAAERKAAPMLVDRDEGDEQAHSSPVVSELPLRAELEPKAGTGDLGGGASGWCNSQYYSQGYGSCSGGYDWQICLDNWMNGAWAEHVDVRYVYTNVCPETGGVMLGVDFDNGGDGAWSVSTNHMRYWSGSDWDCEQVADFDCPHFRADVLFASGDRFNFRVHALE